MTKKELLEKIVELEFEMKALRKELEEKRLLKGYRAFAPNIRPINLEKLELKLNMLYEYLQLELACVPSRTFVRPIAQPTKAEKKRTGRQGLRPRKTTKKKTAQS